jgi:hypothetical protein
MKSGSQDCRKVFVAKGSLVMTEDPSDDRCNALTLAMAEALRVLIEEHGFEPPLFLSVIAVNGSVMAFRYRQGDDGPKTEVLAEYLDATGFALPINIMFVDARGEAARMRIGREAVAYDAALKID